jgi:DNA-binding MarR family transcriptional regulator
MNTNLTNEQTTVSKAGHISNTFANLDKGNNLPPELDELEPHIQITHEVLHLIIKHGLNTGESKLFLYLLKFDRDNSEMKNVPSLQDMAKAVGTSAKQVKRKLAKLEKLGIYKTKAHPDSF